MEETTEQQARPEIDRRLLSLKRGKIEIEGFDGEARYQNLVSIDEMVFIVRTGKRTISTITINPSNVNITGERRVSFTGNYQQGKSFYLPSNKKMRDGYLMLDDLLRENIK